MASQDSRTRGGTQRAVAAGYGRRLNALCCCTMLATSLTTLLLAFAPQGDEAQAPEGLTIVIADVGQGDGVVIQAPDGVVHCVDAGNNGQGSATMVPLIQSLQPTGYGYTVCSHFHADHLGGLDTVLNSLPFQVALDRGLVSTPTTITTNSAVSRPNVPPCVGV